MIITVPTNKINYTRTILSTVNTFLNLSPKELEVLVVMIENNLVELDTESRAKLRKLLNMDQAILNTYIHKLKRGNNIITNNKNLLTINPYITKLINDRVITYNFEIIEST